MALQNVNVKLTFVSVYEDAYACQGNVGVKTMQPCPFQRTNMDRTTSYCQQNYTDLQSSLTVIPLLCFSYRFLGKLHVVQLLSLRV